MIDYLVNSFGGFVAMFHAGYMMVPSLGWHQRLETIRDA